MPFLVDRRRRFVRIWSAFRRVRRRRFDRICRAFRRVRRRFVGRRRRRRGLMINAPVVRMGFLRVRRLAMWDAPDEVS